MRAPALLAKQLEKLPLVALSGDLAVGIAVISYRDGCEVANWLGRLTPASPSDSGPLAWKHRIAGVQAPLWPPAKRAPPFIGAAAAPETIAPADHFTAAFPLHTMRLWNRGRATPKPLIYSIGFGFELLGAAASEVWCAAIPYNSTTVRG